MTEKQPNHDRGRPNERRRSSLGRRTFLAAGSGLGVTLVAGCTSESSPADESTDSKETDESTGDATAAKFRLLISDMPADIGDFDRLDVSFDSARIFDGGAEEDEDEQGDEADDTDAEDRDDESNETADEDETETDDEDAADTTEEDTADSSEDEGGETSGDAEAETTENTERHRGFYVLDLEDATVDLTQVVGGKAMSVFDGELSAGSYNKIELHVSNIEGIVDGEPVDVKLPSEKLQITSAFELRADDPVDFVFDINVVKRGQGNSYILKPVIAKSGVSGKDVDVEEIDNEQDADDKPDSDEEGDGDDGDDGEGADTDTGEDADTGASE